MRESDLQCAIFQVLFDRGHSHVTPNAHLYAWESDVLSITASGYMTEYEVKLSRSDFKRDQMKKRHRVLTRAARRDAAMDSNVPRRLFYACPPGLIRANDLPAYAGLVYVRPGSLTERANAPSLTTAKVRDHQKNTLARSLMWSAWKQAPVKER